MSSLKLSSPTLTALALKSTTTAAPNTYNSALYTGSAQPSSPIIKTVYQPSSVQLAPTDTHKAIYEAAAKEAAAQATISLGPSRPATPAPVSSQSASQMTNPGIAQPPVQQQYAGGGGGSAEPQYEEQPYAPPYASEADSAASSLSGYSAEPTWNDDAAVPVPNNGIVVSTPNSKTALATTSKNAVKPSLLDRILNFFGLSRNRSSVAAHGESFEQNVSNIVRRARAGDQVATAIITLARENAAKGDSRAKQAIAAILKYCEKNPPESISMHGETARVDCRDPFILKAIQLAEGPLLSNPRIAHIVETCQFSGEEHKSMLHGFNNPRTVPHRKMAPNLKQAHGVGRMLGMAKRLQAVRRGAPISKLDPVIGWELGE